MEKFWNNPLTAHVYNIFVRLPPTKKLHNAIGESILVKKKAPILEVGSGTGALAKILLKKDPNVEIIGVEPSVNMISKTLELSEEPNVHLIRAVGEHLPLRESSLPLIALVFSYHHLRDPGQTLIASFKALKPSGFILIFEADSTLKKQEVREAFKKIGLPYPLGSLAYTYLKKTGHAVDPNDVLEKIRKGPGAENMELRVQRMIDGSPISVVEIKKIK